MVVAKGWGMRMGSYCLMSTEFQFYKTKRVTELHGGVMGVGWGSEIRASTNQIWGMEEA